MILSSPITSMVANRVLKYFFDNIRHFFVFFFWLYDRRVRGRMIIRHYADFWYAAAKRRSRYLGNLASKTDHFAYSQSAELRFSSHHRKPNSIVPHFQPSQATDVLETKLFFKFVLHPFLEYL